MKISPNLKNGKLIKPFSIHSIANTLRSAAHFPTSAFSAFLFRY